MAAIWSFKCYVSREGVDQIRAAYDDELKTVQAKFLSRMKALVQLPYAEWVKGGVLAKDLKGDCAGLTELRFFAGNVQQRPLGFRSGENEFTLLFWAHEKGGKWVESGACTTARHRKEELSKGKAKANALWLALE